MEPERIGIKARTSGRLFNAVQIKMLIQRVDISAEKWLIFLYQFSLAVRKLR